MTIVERALFEHDLWDGREETTAFGSARIRKYWEEGVGVIPGYGPEVAWSGSFVAWVAHQGAPGTLARSGRHSVYARAAINNPKVQAYKAYPAYVVTDVRPGDIVLKGRPGESHTFGVLHADESINSHADIVVEVSPKEAIAIGGNKTGNTVRKEVYPRAPDGTVMGGVFAVLRSGPAPSWYFNAPEWRRARDSEVTPEMRADAVTAVRALALGELLYGDDYLIAVETHWDAQRGHHRGASVFLPATNLEAVA